MLDRLHKAKIFTKIDLENAYRQVRVKEGDEWKTTFICREGHFEYQVCPQGPTNAPAMFQHFMNDILREYLDLIAVGLFDDVIVFSESLSDHVPHVRSLLRSCDSTNCMQNAVKKLYAVYQPFIPLPGCPR